MDRKETIVLGAGLSGLSTVIHVGGDWLVLEREGRPGGLTRTEDIDGFLFDCTGHWLHLRDERVKRMAAELLPDGLSTVVRRAAIYTNRSFTRYPFQANLCGLPSQILRECLQGAVEAAVRRAGRGGAKPRNFLEYANFHFGEGIARHFIVPYNTKLWGVSPDQVTAEWTQRFVPVPDVAQIVDGALGFSREAMGYNATFLYPTRGGIETLPRAMFARLPADRFLFSTRPRRIRAAERWVEFGTERVRFDRLVSSVPLPELVDLTEDAPPALRRAARRLRCSVLRYVNVGLSVERPLDGEHWLYLPEARFPFYRVGSASNALPGLAPTGASSLYVELANDQAVPDGDVVRALAEFLKEIGTIQRDSQLLFAAFREHPYGYVIFDRHCARARASILDWFEARGIDSIGRYGGWTYNSMEDAILDGIRVADRARKG
ncbi:MAG: FAD-dependent oxidoreductase [Deltaproteobacteria bacterium]|nr:FAD-dependent oxidoreductase [Deltaproteobacteria bacterium]